MGRLALHLSFIMTSKKFLPFIVLILAALLLLYVKNKQRGTTPRFNDDNITIPVKDELSINRNASKIIYSNHARCRMACRHIDESEVKEILANGKINVNKIQQDERGATYPLEGITHDRQHVRIVFAPKGNNALEVVTCIDLDTDWACDCK